MSFDIHQVVFAEDGTYLEEKASRYEAALMEQFAASPEGQALTERGTELGWAGVLVHYAIRYPGVTPPTMTTGDLEEVVYDLFPRKVVTEPGDGAEIIQELHAFWQFLHRAYHLPGAPQLLALLTPQAAARLERKLQDPRHFGLAKSFVLLGQEAGFDMESPEGMRAWVEVYNATVAPLLATAARQWGSSTSKPLRRVSTSTRNGPPRKPKRPPPIVR